MPYQKRHLTDNKVFKLLCQKRHQTDNKVLKMLWSFHTEGPVCENDLWPNVLELEDWVRVSAGLRLCTVPLKSQSVDNHDVCPPCHKVTIRRQSRYLSAVPLSHKPSTITMLVRRATKSQSVDNHDVCPPCHKVTIRWQSRYLSAVPQSHNPSTITIFVRRATKVTSHRQSRCLSVVPLKSQAIRSRRTINSLLSEQP